MSVHVCPPPAPVTLPLRTTLAVGFGIVEVTCDGHEVWCGDSERVTVGNIEKLAQTYFYGDRQRGRSLKSDWVIRFGGPMSDDFYHRKGRGKWVLVHRGMGFA